MGGGELRRVLATPHKSTAPISTGCTHTDGARQGARTGLQARGSQWHVLRLDYRRRGDGRPPRPVHCTINFQWQATRHRAHPSSGTNQPVLWADRGVCQEAVCGAPPGVQGCLHLHPNVKWGRGGANEGCCKSLSRVQAARLGGSGASIGGHRAALLSRPPYIVGPMRRPCHIVAPFTSPATIMQSTQCFAMAAPVAPVVLPSGSRTSAAARAAFRPAAGRRALKQRVQLRAIAQEASGATGWLTGGVLLHRRQRAAGRRRPGVLLLLGCLHHTHSCATPHPPFRAV